MALNAVVLAGGSGTRLWPYSRRASPKQLLPLLEGRSLLQMTVDRLAALVPTEHQLVVASAPHVDEIRRQLPHLPAVRVVAEPQALGTAAAIGLAAGIVAATDPNAVMLVLPADHLIDPPDRYLADVRRAESLAAAGHLVTFGVPPDRPETGYGYIELGADLPGASGARAVKRFVEKPDARTAAEYVASGRFVWNSGMFAWTAEAIGAALRTHLPSIARAMDTVRHGRPSDAAWLDANLPALYEGIAERTTIDYGVMERSQNVACVPVTFRWNDVGSWSAVAEAMEADPEGNAIRGPLMAIDTSGTLVYGAAGRLVAAIGLQDMVIVDTPDALLVCPKSRAQDVKEIVRALQASQHSGLL